MRKTKQVTLRSTYEQHAMDLAEIFFNSPEPSGTEIDIQEAYSRSTKTLGSYVTLDWEHKRGINKISQTIKNYSSDITQKRPLNIIMLAEPGSGKSHFVKCLAKTLQDINIAAVTYNMAALQQQDDLVQPLDAVRNLKVQDKLPILFLDEFDSDFKYIPLLLPLLWDGEVQLGHRELKMGKLIIILAGSNPKIRTTIKEIQKMEKDPEPFKEDNKLVDLLSRINGGLLEIPSLEIVNSNIRDRRVDKICLTLSLLQKRFGNNLQLVPWSLLKFIGETKFRYGVRSIALFIDSIPYSSNIVDKIIIDDLQLPLNSEHELKKSNLAYHIIASDADEDISGIVSRWNSINKYATLVRFREISNEEEPIV
jgi:hypothetical protein